GAALRDEGRALRERVAIVERRLRREHGVPAVVAAPVVEPIDMDRFEAARFDERFRGSEGEIKERQRVYLPYVAGKGDVLDIGCGRGEFLELLREAGIRGRGTDLNPDMILLCREKGLVVERADARAYLDGLPA